MMAEAAVHIVDGEVARRNAKDKPFRFTSVPVHTVGSCSDARRRNSGRAVDARRRRRRTDALRGSRSDFSGRVNDLGWTENRGFSPVAIPHGRAPVDWLNAPRARNRWIGDPDHPAHDSSAVE